jgi:hypothetical protein
MSFILTPNHGEDMKINAWNWRPTILLLRHANLIDEQQHERLGHQGCGGTLDPETAARIRDFMDQHLAKMFPGQRLGGDLTITSEPKKRAVFTPDSRVEDFDAVEVYSATYEWLVMFRDFCRTSQGFSVT